MQRRASERKHPTMAKSSKSSEPATNADGTPAEVPAKTTAMASTTIPVAMKEIIDRAAEDAKQSPALWLRTQLASLVNYTLPAESKRGRQSDKYVGLTDEEKKVAQSAEQTVKRNKSAALLAAFEAGEDLTKLSLDQIIAKYAPKPRVAKPKTVEVSPEAAMVNV